MKYKEIITNLKELNITPQIITSRFDWMDKNFAKNFEKDEEGKTVFNMGVRGKVIIDEVENIFKEVFGEYKYIMDNRMNDEVNFVIHFVEHNVYIIIEGWYSEMEEINNYSEGEFKECKPVKRLFTSYERIDVPSDEDLKKYVVAYADYLENNYNFRSVKEPYFEKKKDKIYNLFLQEKELYSE